MSANKFSLDVCPHQLSFLLDNFLRKKIQNPESITGEYIEKGDTVIDLGCGPGYFTIDMAEMAGETGKVIAVDIQQKMLDTVRKKAVRSGVEDRIVFLKATPGNPGIGISIKADFILAYYMIHETGDYVSFLSAVKENLKKGGKILIVEPAFHVSKNKYFKLVSEVEDIGYTVLDKPEGKGGRSLLLTV